MVCQSRTFSFFFFNDTATTEIYTLSLHDALPILQPPTILPRSTASTTLRCLKEVGSRSEEHTSELQSHLNLVCRLLLEKKKKIADGDNLSALSQRHPAARFSPSFPVVAYPYVQTI